MISVSRVINQMMNHLTFLASKILLIQSMNKEARVTHLKADFKSLPMAKIFSIIFFNLDFKSNRET